MVEKKSELSPLQDPRFMLFSNYHVKDVMPLFLVSHYALWLLAAHCLVVTQPLSAWDDSSFVSLSVFLLLCLLSIRMAVSSLTQLSLPLFCPFVFFQLMCATAMLGYGIGRFDVNHARGYYLYLMLIYFAVVLYMMFYCLYITYKFIGFLNAQLPKEKPRKARRCVDIFSQRIFPTPPLKEFERVEFARGHDLSSFHMEDIFGDDYKEDVILV